MRINGNPKVLFIIGVVILVISFCIIGFSIPPISSLGSVQGTVTSAQHCICDGGSKKRHTTSSGLHDEYTFEYQDQMYTGREKSCRCSILASDNSGQKVLVFFDKNDPEDNILFGDVAVLFIMPLIGAFLIFFAIFSRRSFLRH